MPCELWLVRHGETAWSAASRHTSSTDLPLTADGRTAAVAVGRRLLEIEFDKVLVSPLARARQTCALAGFEARSEIDPDLHEWNYGLDEGRTTEAIREDRPGWSIWTDGPAGGETIDAISHRADRVIARVRAADGRVLAFAHAHICRVVAARWTGLPAADGRCWKLDTASVSVLSWDRDTPVVRLWNDVGQLRA